MAHNAQPHPSTTSGTARIGHIAFDSGAIERDLTVLDGHYGVGYREYSSGVWESLMLANRTGHSGDALSVEYADRAQPTELAQMAPGIMRLIGRGFDTSRMKSARLFRMSDYGMIVPHRDYGEFKEGFLRVHVVLETYEGCFNTEESTGFHMAEGEIWFLQGRRTHSAVTLGAAPRTHLVLDFDPDATFDDVVKPKYLSALEHRDVANRVERQPLSIEEVAALEGLGSLLNEFTWPAVLDLFQRIHAVREVPTGICYDWLDAAAQKSAVPVLVDRAAAMRAKFIGE